MNRLAFVVPGALERPTGGSRYDRRMVEGLRAQGADIEVHCLQGDFPEPDAKAADALRHCLAQLTAQHWVIVDGLVFGANPSLFASQARRLNYIALVHHPLADETGLSSAKRAAFQRSEAAALALAQGVIVTSDFTRRRLAQLALYQHPVHVVTPGVEHVALRAPRTPSSVHFLCLGSLIPRKGQDQLIASLDLLKEHAWRASLVGSTDLNPAFTRECQAQIDQAGLSNRITLTGALSDRALEEMWASADVLVLPSRYEGYGMVVTEAIARGIPVITTDAGALPETLPRGAGLCVARDDPAALTQALTTVIQSPQRLEELTRQARATRAALKGWPEQAIHFAHAIQAIRGDD